MYREAALHERGTYGKTKEETEKRELIFHELIEYLEVFRETSSCISMALITKMYKQNLDSSNLDSSGVHCTRLRKSILEAIPDIKEVKHHNGTYDLVFDSDLSAMVMEMKEVSLTEKIYSFLKLLKVVAKRY